MFEIGSTLREARVRRNLTLQQVAEDTKIRAKYIQAMENEDFDVMPGSTYVKGFLRTYSTYLELDAEVILGEYCTRGQAPREIHEPFGGVSTLGGPRSHRRRNTVVVLAVVCLVALAIIWVLGQGGQDATKPPSTHLGALGITSSSPSAKASISASSSARPTTKPIPLRLTAKYGASWVEVRRASATGPVIFSGTLQRGSSKVIKEGDLWLRFGYPSVLILTINGTHTERINENTPLSFFLRNGKLTRVE